MKKFLINVNGNSYEVELEEVGGDAAPQGTAQAMPKVSEAAPAPKKEVKSEAVVSAGQEAVEAPMPGNIWKVLVSEGQDVKEGDTLLILEAMKMENEILAPRAGKVAKIAIKEGVAVSTGEKLIILD